MIKKIKSRLEARPSGGTAGGQLEFVGMRFLSKQIDGRWQKFVALKFTDHDLQAVPEESLVDAGLKPYYELEFPVTS